MLKTTKTKSSDNPNANPVLLNICSLQFIGPTRYNLLRMIPAVTRNLRPFRNVSNCYEAEGHPIIGHYVIRQRARHQTAMSCAGRVLHNDDYRTPRVYYFLRMSTCRPFLISLGRHRETWSA